MPLYNQFIRFKGEESLIDYIAHVDNLVVKAILKSLGSSTHQDACAFLNRVKVLSQNKITLLIAIGDIAILRIVVLQMNKSPQQIKDQQSRLRVKKNILYDINTRQNYTLIMLKAAFEHRAPLQAQIKDYKELAYLVFDSDRWDRLKQIRDLLKLFEEHTIYVSREEPTLHRLSNLYLKLNQLL